MHFVCEEAERGGAPKCDGRPMIGELRQCPTTMRGRVMTDGNDGDMAVRISFAAVASGELRVRSAMRLFCTDCLGVSPSVLIAASSVDMVEAAVAEDI